MNAPILTRRSFGKAVGGLVVAFSLDPAEILAQGAGKPAPLPGSLNTNRSLRAWVRIGGDGNATVSTGKVELGQGILTALWQIAAEELDLPLERVKIYSADTALSPDEGQTAGSQSIENSGTALRLACAEVRGMLVDLAAAKLAVPAGSLTVADGVILTADRLKVTYAEAVAGLDLDKEATGKVAPKPVTAHKIVGQSTPRLDIPGKVTGRISYVQDIYEAGTVHGRVVRPPRYGSTLEKVDDAAVSKMPGVIKVVRDGSFLGVVAEREEQAIKAREALVKTATWKLGPELPDPANIHAHLKSLPSTDSVLGVKQGPAPAANARTLEASYTKPYLSHGSIGPSCAVATFLNNRMMVWTHSQGVFPLRNELVKALKLPAKDIRCMHVEGSGCYGQNGADDVALDAALLARAVPDKPVRVQWMRDDEFGWEPFGAAMSMSVKASLDADGKIADWHYELWSNTHSMRPESTDGTNVLAIAIHGRAAVSRPGEGHPAAGRRRRPQFHSALRFPEPEGRAPLHPGDADPGLGAAHARRLRQCVRDRILHGRDGCAGQGRPGGVPARASEGPARQGRGRKGRRDGELESRRGGQPQPRPRHRLRQVQEPRHLRRCDRRRRDRPRERQGSRDAGVGCRGFRPDHQSGRAEEPDRGRRSPVDELDALRAGAFRQERHPVARLGQLSHHDHAGCAEGHGRADQPAE